MTNEEAVKVLESIAVNLTGSLGELTENPSMAEFLERKIEAINTAQAALRAQDEAEKNDPLTLEQLREMDGEPVWIVFTPDADGERPAMWALVSADDENKEIFLLNSIGGASAYAEIWADVEAIYRRRPEEEYPECDEEVQ